MDKILILIVKINVSFDVTHVMHVLTSRGNWRYDNEEKINNLKNVIIKRKTKYYGHINERIQNAKATTTGSTDYGKKVKTVRGRPVMDESHAGVASATV